MEREVQLVPMERREYQETLEHLVYMAPKVLSLILAAVSEQLPRVY